MKHDFELTHCDEWSDDYRCFHCGKEIVVAAEDSLSDEGFASCFGECPQREEYCDEG